MVSVDPLWLTLQSRDGRSEREGGREEEDKKGRERRSRRIRDSQDDQKTYLIIHVPGRIIMRRTAAVNGSGV
jgi:hypothetical protein